MDHDRNEKPITEQEGVMFAAQPIWERRGNKRRSLGARKAAAPAPTVAPEPRSFATARDDDEPMALDTPVDPVTGDYQRTRYDEMRPAATAAMTTTAPATAAPVTADEPAADASLVAPIGRPSTRADRGPKSKGMGPAAIAAGVVALGAIGAVGWYATRDNDGIPELAPGQVTGSQVAAAPLPPVDLPPTPAAADTAVNPPAAATPPRATVRAAPARAERRMASANRTRPAAPSAGDTGVNASTTTTLPGGPQPYSTLNPGATPPPVNPTTAVAPPPAESPAQIPSTLPTEATPPTATPAPAETPQPPM